MDLSSMFNELINQWSSMGGAADVRLLSAIGIGVHWLILQYSLGLLFLGLVFEIVSIIKKNQDISKMARSLTNVAVVIFAIGAATGTISEFGLILFWPNLSVLVGKYFFIPMYLEMFGFIAEVVFIYLYYYTWNKVSNKVHVTIGIIAVTGAFLAALLIIAVNALMNIPPGLIPGYDFVTGVWTEPQFQLISQAGEEFIISATELQKIIVENPTAFHEIMFATVTTLGAIGLVISIPGILVSFLHTIGAAINVTILSALAVFTFRYLKYKSNENDERYYLTGIKFLLVLSLIFLSIQGFVFGHLSGELVAHFNPEKFAAMEGNSDTIFIFSGFIPFLDKFMAFLAFGNFDAIIPNWDSLDPMWQPPLITHYIYYSKITLSIILGLFITSLVIYLFILKKNFKTIPRPIQYLILLTPFAINYVVLAGWATKEIGRKPWTVYGLITPEQAVTQTGISPIIILLVVLYIIGMFFLTLIAVWFIFRKKPEVPASGGA
jgi:cytochrome d ubiquinol oxidase subunit I